MMHHQQKALKKEENLIMSSGVNWSKMHLCKGSSEMMHLKGIFKYNTETTRAVNLA